ncbi:MAG: hypothetical protein WB421_18000 [Terriglobales bacterium]
MDFDIRAMSLVESIPADARVPVSDVLGKHFQFRAGLSYNATMPQDPNGFSRLPEPERILTVLQSWSRVYGYRDGDYQIIHIVAPSENENGDLNFYRLDFRQASKPKIGPRPEIEVTGGAIMSHDDCVTWLIELAVAWRNNPGQKNLTFVIKRPCAYKPGRIRMAWVVPSIVEYEAVRNRVIALGKVYGIDVIQIEPRSYRETYAGLARSMPYDAIVICRKFAPQITADAVPEAVSRDLIHFCDSSTLRQLEEQIRSWIEISLAEVESRSQTSTLDEHDFVLALMLRAMLSHSKIGESSHCPKETVLKVIRGRRLNVPKAEQVLIQNSEAHLDTKISDCIFLWKEHNDGRQYFLNPRRVEDVKAMVAAHLSTF